MNRRAAVLLRRWRAAWLTMSAERAFMCLVSFMGSPVNCTGWALPMLVPEDMAATWLETRRYVPPLHAEEPGGYT